MNFKNDKETMKALVELDIKFATEKGGNKSILDLKDLGFLINYTADEIDTFYSTAMEKGIDFIRTREDGTVSVY